MTKNQHATKEHFSVKKIRKKTLKFGDVQSQKKLMIYIGNWFVSFLDPTNIPNVH